MPVLTESNNYAVGFRLTREAGEPLKEMLGASKRYGALLSTIILTEYARRQAKQEERQRLQQLLAADESA
jgi:hypothetical protein